ncbi:MAG: TIGR04283 family arsenosugar biosynthesis glycosyltransferase [Rhodospirillales bacterium]
MMASAMTLSLIIPTLNNGERLAAMIRAWQTALGPDEIIVSDGGSTDGTGSAAEQSGAVVVRAPSGRGNQLRAGAEHATGDWLLFMHADTLPGANAGPAARAFMTDTANTDRAAAFRLTLDDEEPAARRIERLANWRAQRFSLPYGDQGLLVSRAAYGAAGGYRPIPLMEDVDLVRRFGRSRVDILNAEVATSAERYRRDGYWARPMRNITLLSLFFLGVSPVRLARWYG